MSGKGIHLPNPSYWPLVTAIGMLVFFTGFIVGFPYVNIAGVLVTFIGIFSWAFEPA